MERSTSGHGHITVMKQTNTEMLSAEWASFRGRNKIIDFIIITDCSLESYKIRWKMDKESEVKKTN